MPENEYKVQQCIEKQEQAWNMLENLLSRQYMNLIPHVSVEASQIGIDDVLKTVRADKITRIIYDKAEDNLTKFSNLFSAMYSSGSTVFVLLHNRNNVTEIYLGVKAENPSIANTSSNTLLKSLHGNFPGVSHEPLNGSKQTGQLSDFMGKGGFVACVSGVPSLKNDGNKNFAQGLEKIIDAMGNTSYTAMFLATPISRTKLDSVERAYQDLYSSLSLLNIEQLSLAEQESIALGTNISKTLSQSISNSISNASTYTKSTNTSATLTQTTADGITDSRSHASTDTLSHSSTDSLADSESLSYSKGHSHSVSESNTTSRSIGLNIIVANASRSSSHTKGTTDTDTETYTKGNTRTTSHADTVGRANANTDTTGRSVSRTNSAARGQMTGEGFSDAQGKTLTDGTSETTSNTNSASETSTTGTSTSYNYKVTDKHVAESLKLIDEQLERIRSARNYGAWNWAGYFVADDPATARNGADIYTGILSGEKTGIERTSVIIWDDQDSPELKSVRNALARFEHPIFLTNGYAFNATSMVTTPEVAVGMSLPQKSLPNIPVFESTQFGRAVVTFERKVDSTRICPIGFISHLGTTTAQKVCLSIDSLCSHTFVTGSTGAGKTKGVNILLKGVVDKGANFLVIEPAKGEYKDIWGGLRRCNVFGTNSTYTDLLKINPFSFPQRIHIMEHIDRLIEILNAVWPMYAAMPAILKDAVEKTYEQFGWNLRNSECSFIPMVFPDFVDLIKILPKVIEQSEYSDETKGNYSGALITRIHSLTNGYYRSIFQKEEIDDEVLFDQNTIVDLSRVGSSETKSLLMGIIFLKLQEYRIAQSSSPDQKLKHITVLEEAHHLLRRTSIEQGEESANLQGKSVEMLTNAIAEMRTYGEGFIIADQAPGLLDQSVIRNTNTKIVFRLPDYDDRKLVGKSQNLTDEQITELSRLRTGCAAVYQNDWQEAVLCQFDLFAPSSLYGVKGIKAYVPAHPHRETDDSRAMAEKTLLSLLMKNYSTGKMCNVDTPDDARRMSLYYPQFFSKNNEISEHNILYLLNEYIVKSAIEAVPPVSNQEIWEKQLFQIIAQKTRSIYLTSEEMKALRCAVYQILAEYDMDPRQKIYWQECAKMLKGGLKHD